MTSRFACRIGIAALLLAACGGGGGGDGNGETRHSLTVTLTGAAGGGRVTSTPAGIDCPGTCSAEWDAGTVVSLAQAPAASHVFTGWGGSCSGTGSCSVTLDANRAVSADFAAEQLRHTLAVTLTGAAGGGRVTSTPAGIDCPGTCSAEWGAGTAVALAQVPAAGHVFTGWGGSCSGTAACGVSLTADRAVSAGFDGPTDVTVATPYGYQGFPLSLLPGESLSVPVTTALAKGAPGQATLTATGLPAGVTAAFDPAEVAAGGPSTLSVTAAAGAPITAAPAGASVVATTAYGTRSASLPVEVRSPRALSAPGGLAYEADGQQAPTTAVVAETVPGFAVGRIVRVDLQTRLALRTIASGTTSAAGPVGLGAPRGLVVNLPATFALAAHAGGLARVDLASGAITEVTRAGGGGLGPLGGVAWDPSDSGAVLVTECGAVAGCTAGRLSSVALATGVVTPIGAATLNDPAGIVSYNTVAERGAGRVVSLWSDPPTVLAEGLDHPSAFAQTFAGGLLVTTAGGDLAAVGSAGGAITFLDLPGAETAARPIAASPWSWAEALVVLRDPDRLVRLALFAREPQVYGPAPGQDPFVAPRAFTDHTGYLVTDCGPGGEAACDLTGRVVRLAQGTGETTVVASGLADPRGIANGPGTEGAPPVLVAEHGADRLLGLDPTSGAVDVLANGIPGPWGVALEDALAGLVLVSAEDGVYRVVLGTGAVTPVASLTPACGAANHGRGIALLAPGTAVVAEACPPQLTQVDLATGALTPLPVGLEDPRMVHAWGEGMVADAGQGGRVLLGVAGGTATVMASGLAGVVDAYPSFGGGVVWLDAGVIAYTVSGGQTQAVVQKLERPSGIALEPDGSTALLVDCGGDAACEGTGRLLSLDLGGYGLTELYAGLTAPAAVARAGSLAVLVADCETAATCATAGRISRIEGGSRTTLAGGLADPAFVALEPSGTSLLVAERAAGRITRVALAGGAKTPVAPGLSHPRQVVPEEGGETALVAEDGRVVRISLATGAATPVVAWDAERFVLVPGRTAILMLPRRDAPGPAQLIAFGELLTGAIDVWATPLTDAPDTAIWAPNLNRIFFTERRSGTGAVHALFPP